MLDTKIAPWPYFDEEQVEAVSQVLRSGRVNNWTSQEVKLFEQEFAQYLGTKHAIAVANGTLALELALIALGIGSGDEVIVTPRTFVASASVAILRGATAVFVDVDPATGNITADTIQRGVTSRTKAIICVHLGGLPCDMDPIMDLAERNGIFVIEDCAQAHGARYKGRQVGSIGHINAFSFCQDKILTTGGEGGLVTTNNDKWWQQMWMYKDHGKDFAAMTQHSSVGTKYRWVHSGIGNNYRMMPIQAVLGRIQLKRLNQWVERRRQIASSIRTAAAATGKFRFSSPTNEFYDANYRQYLYVEQGSDYSGRLRDKILEQLRAQGAPAFVGSCGEVNRESCFNKQNSRVVSDMSGAKRLFADSIALLTHPNMTSADVELYQRALSSLS